MSPKVTILVLNHNGLADLSVCLQSIRKLTYPNLQTIVIDNGSDMSEVIKIKKLINSKIKLIHFHNNLSFSEAYNKVLKSINCQYVFIINNDTKLTPNSINLLAEFAESNQDVAIIQPKLLSLRDKNIFDYSGACGGFVDMLGYPYCRGRVVFEVEKDKSQYNQTTDIFWSSGAAMFCRLDVLKKVGLFDEDLDSFAEDQDLCWRILKMGYKIISLPRAVVYHKTMGTWRSYLNKKTYLIHRNHLLLLVKHLTLGRLVLILPIRIIMDYFSVIYYVYTGIPEFSLSVLRAHLDFFRLFGLFWRKRSDKNSDREKLIETKFMNPNSIIWAYFWQKKRKFSDLPSFTHTQES